jgi:plasmid maintenance system antidote protein VapI
MKLACYFVGDARSWLTLQSAYNLRVAEILNATRIKREIAPAAVR